MAQGAKDIRSIKEEHCCGCGACVNACPVERHFYERRNGNVLFPVIDQNRCIHCGKCLRACPAAQEAQPVAKTAAQAAAEKAQPEVKTAAQAAAEKAQPGVKTAAGEKGRAPVLRRGRAGCDTAVQLLRRNLSGSGGPCSFQKGAVYGAAWGENALFVEHVRDNGKTGAAPPFRFQIRAKQDRFFLPAGSKGSGSRPPCAVFRYTLSKCGIASLFKETI